MTNNVISISSHPRFASTTTVSSNSELVARHRKSLQDLAAKNDNFKIHEAGTDRPKTAIQTGMSKLKRGALVWGGALMAGVVGLVGWRMVGHYNDVKPTAETRAFHTAMKKDFDTWNEAAKTLKMGPSNPQYLGQFNQATEALISRLALTLEKNPGQLDQEIVKQLRWTSTFFNADVINNEAHKFFNFMETQLKAQGVNWDNMSTVNAEAIKEQTILTGFVQKTDLFTQLTPDQQRDVAKDLRREFIQNTKNGTYQAPTLYSKVIQNSVPTGIQGVNASDFAGVKTKADAVKLFSQVVNNSKNYSQMTRAQKDAFIARGSQALNSIDYESHGLLGFTAYALLLLGAAGAAGALFVKRQEAIQAFTSAGDFYSGVTKPVLVVDQDSFANPDNKADLAMTRQRIEAMASDFAGALKQAYNENPDAKKVLDSKYGGIQNLPTANDIIQRFEEKTKEDVLGGYSFKDKVAEKPITELELARSTFIKMEDAFEKGDLVEIGLAKELTAVAPPDPKSAKEPLEQIKLQKRYLDYQIDRSLKFLANRGIKTMLATNSLKSAKAQLDAVNDRIKKEGAANQSNQQWRSEVGTLLQDAQGKVAQEQKLYDTASKLELQSKFEIGQQLKDGLKFQKTLEQAIASGEYASHAEELKRMKQETEATLTQPEVKKSLEDNDIARILKMSQDEIDAEMAKVHAMTASAGK